MEKKRLSGAVGRFVIRTWACILLLCSACGPIDLGTEAGEGGASAGKVGAEVAPADTAALAARAVTVSEALTLPEGTEVVVRGYIAGYAAGTTLASARFGVPEDRANTNMLIADRAGAMYEDECMPIKLATTGANPRAALNMYDYPENFGREIVLVGVLETYFKVNGLLSFRYFWTGNRGNTDWFGEAETDTGASSPAGRMPGIVSGPAVMEGR